MIDQNSVNKFRKDFYKIISDAKAVLITSHISPDDDSIASVLSMYALVREFQPDKKVDIKYSSVKKDRWEYFENFDKIQFGTDISETLPEYDVLIGLDASEYFRFSKFPDAVKEFKGKKICIDHHANLPDYYDLQVVTEEQSSTAQLIYSLFFADTPVITARTAECLLLGILGDSAWFTVNMKQANLEIFDVVKRLVRDGKIDMESFGSKYMAYTSRIFCVIQECVKNTRFVEISGWPKMLCTYISLEFIKNNDFSEVEINEGAHIFTGNYLKKLKDVPFGANLYPTKEGIVNCSLRSRPGTVDVSKIGPAMGLEGGGHPGAGGVTFKKEGAILDPKECLDQLLDWMSKNSPVVYPNH